jgi:hypothetical protein
MTSPSEITPGHVVDAVRADPMWEQAYMDVQAILDSALGTEEEDGAGGGIAADVHLLALQRDEARSKLADSREHGRVREGERDEARAELAKAGELIRSLERAAGHKLRELYAAYIEVVHGTADDAGTILIEALDGYDGPQWNGNESGIEWLERTEASEVTP